MTTETSQNHILCDSRSQQDVITPSGGGFEGAEAWIAAWWIGQGEAGEVSTVAKGLIHVYETHLKPSQPLEIARRIRIFALPKAAPKSLGANLRKHRAYDPHVTGVVAGIEKAREGWVRVTIQNHCRGNTVRTVLLDIVHVPEESLCGRGTEAEGARTGWISAQVPNECIAHFGHLGHTGHPGTLGRRGDGSRGVGRDGAWARNGDGDGEGRRSGSSGRSGRGQAMCGAEKCGLELPPEYAGERDRTTWMVMEKRVQKEVPRQGLEGVFRLHMWLKYEGAP
ncbi:hypothetical protein C8T65DRAFT_693485 [Cerioporus squamosus]|nr:hypothetical protein C8T65DRAFT_693485 [Cerioporus squamosus]